MATFDWNSGEQSWRGSRENGAFGPLLRVRGRTVGSIPGCPSMPRRAPCRSVETKELSSITPGLHPNRKPCNVLMADQQFRVEGPRNSGTSLVYLDDRQTAFRWSLLSKGVLDVWRTEATI